MIRHRINRIFVLLLTLSCTILFLSGCKGKMNIIGLSSYYYEDSDKYLVGEAELSNKVEDVEISWLVGKVNVLSTESDKISFFENSKVELIEDTKLHYYLDEKILHINFCACGKYDLSELNKDLTLLVPKSFMISNLKVNTLSADVNLSNCAVTKSVKINTLSGITEANFIQPLVQFKGESTSGVFKVNAPLVSNFDVDSISGEVSLNVSKEPDSLNIDTTSGNINLKLPKSASFTLDYDSTSGDLYSDLSCRKLYGKYIIGNGDKSYKICTVSGNVCIIPDFGKHP